MGTETTRFLIIGGGLAGLLLAWRLREHNPIVLGGSSLPPASDVSAGVLNPVTGGRLTLMDDYGDYLEAARQLYRSVPGGADHFYETTIRRYFVNDLECERFEERRRLDNYRDYLGPRFAAGEAGPASKDTLGSFLIEGVARVEPVPILSSIRKVLGSNFRPVDADWETFENRDSTLSLNGIEAEALICCEGVGVVANPLFRWLPFRPVKGETLTLHEPALENFREIIHHEKWILSLGQNRFRVGSTYRRGNHREEGVAADCRPPVAEPSPEGRDELAKAFRTIFDLKKDSSVVEHKAGIRPSSRDRIPYVGPHPDLKNLFILNGLGSKGALLAPRLTENLAAHLTCGPPLDPKHDPARMISRGFAPISRK